MFMQGSAVIDLLRKAFLPAVCLAVLAYFLNHAIGGRSGLLALDDIRQQKAALIAQQQAIEARRRMIEQKIALLDPAGADPDYADELVRRQLGVIHPDEIIVPLPDVPAKVPSRGG
jgi:cell division protein FtsB